MEHVEAQELKVISCHRLEAKWILIWKMTFYQMELNAAETPRSRAETPSVPLRLLPQLPVPRKASEQETALNALHVWLFTFNSGKCSKDKWQKITRVPRLLSTNEQQAKVSLDHKQNQEKNVSSLGELRYANELVDQSGKILVPLHVVYTSDL